MQQILIGNPLKLTAKGALELHKLKYENTYCYKHTWDWIGLKDKYGEWSFIDATNENISHITEEEFIEQEVCRKGKSANFYILPFNVRTASLAEFNEDIGNIEGIDNNNSSPFEALWFSGDWEYPDEDKRDNKDLIHLFNSDMCREYFDYDNKPRLFVIPEHVDWYIGENDMGNEYIQEKARSWS